MNRQDKAANQQQEIKKSFEDFILNGSYPCVMAQTAFKLSRAELQFYNNFGSACAAREILRDLKRYLKRNNLPSNGYFSFIAAFPEKNTLTEKGFEHLLWKQLQLLHEADESPWDREVNNDPDSDHFSFSVAGRAFYIIGLHPNSSRKARQSPCPALVFNLHSQFERLRALGKYKLLRRKIRSRDKALQGNINPMMDDFGKKSEARQYSGRKVGKEWKCPFHYTKE